MIKPYWTSDDGRHVLYCGDCLEVMQVVDRGDLLLTDPPYGIAYKKGSGGKGIHTRDRRNIESIKGDDCPFDPSPWLQFDNVILWGANHFAQRLPHGRWIAWNKLGDKEPWDSFSDVEFAWQNGRGKDRLFSHLWKGLCQAGAGERRWHPTQKPVALMQWCLSLVPDADTILDPFAGVCTTAVACIRTNRRSISIELEPKYCDIAIKRMQRELSQPRLPFVEPEPVAVQGGLFLEGE